jgi:crotonobetaine/carnitine-CoA ligase
VLGVEGVALLVPVDPHDRHPAPLLGSDHARKLASDIPLERTIPNLLADAAGAAPDQPWLFHGDAVFTYEEAQRRIGTAAARLADLGVARGHLVLVPMRNTADHLFLWLGLMRLGAILVAANPRAGEAELAGLVRQTDPRLVITDRELRPAFEGTPAPTSPPPPIALVDAVLPSGADEDPPDVPGPGPDDPAVLIPTSGTTGRSKLVTQTHRAYVMAGEGFPWWMELTADDRLMTSLPLFHINAPAYSVLGSVAARAGLVLLPRFSPSTFLDDARRYGATEFNAIGAMLEMLMRQPRVSASGEAGEAPEPDDADTPLRLAYSGPAPAEARHDEIEERFGLRLVCGYAMSETPYGTIWPRGTRPYGTLGAIRQHPTLGRVNEGRVRREDEPVPPGEVGELELRNPAVMLGYWGMPEETSRVLRPDGWLRTGDLVVENADGTYTFVGREKEIIRRRGENLSPAEVEEALAAHPAVVEVAVIGVPSDLTEEEVKAFVVLTPPGDSTDPETVSRPDPSAGAPPDPRSGSPPDAPALHAWAAARLTRYKVPRYIEVVADLPHTPTGRLAKHRLPKDRTPTEWDAEA